MQNRVVIGVFIISCAMAAVLLAIILADPVAGSGGVPHPTIPGLMVGGDGAARLAEIGGYAFLFQCLLLLLIVALAALGVPGKHHSLKLYVLLFLSYIFTLIIWWQMYFGHRNSWKQARPDIFSASRSPPPGRCMVPGLVLFP